MDFSAFNFVRLTPKHNLLPFDCGDGDLNDFFFNAAKEHQNQLVAVTYIIETQDETLGFFSVSNDKITAVDVDSNRKFKRLFQEMMPDGKKYRSYPAVKIGRLGITKNHQKSGLGTVLLDYIKGLFITNNRTGCMYITVDAYNQSLGFYQRNGFNFFSGKDKNDDTRQMYFSLLELNNTEY